MQHSKLGPTDTRTVASELDCAYPVGRACQDKVQVGAMYCIDSQPSLRVMLTSVWSLRWL